MTASWTSSFPTTLLLISTTHRISARASYVSIKGFQFSAVPADCPEMETLFTTTTEMELSQTSRKRLESQTRTAITEWESSAVTSTKTVWSISLLPMTQPQTSSTTTTGTAPSKRSVLPQALQL